MKRQRIVLLTIFAMMACDKPQQSASASLKEASSIYTTASKRLLNEHEATGGGLAPFNNLAVSLALSTATTAERCDDAAATLDVFARYEKPAKEKYDALVSSVTDLESEADKLAANSKLAELIDASQGTRKLLLLETREQLTKAHDRIKRAKGKL